MMRQRLDDEVALDPAGIVEVPLLSAMHAECFEERWSPQAMSEVIAGPGIFAMIAHVRDNGGPAGRSPIGFAIARVIGEDSELLSLGVMAASRRRGVAKQLVADVLRRAAEAGARRIFLEVAEDNFAAQGLYRFYGFRLVGRRPDYYRRIGGGTTAALTLRLVLAAER
jgi:[ribosomal protein S18]-alanine N-acetyltransferase